MTHLGWRNVSDFLRTRVDRGEVPAVVSAIADSNGLVYLEAFGKRDVADNADATPDTIFRLASMTKPVTSLAAMILVEKGRIALEDPVTKHLADYQQPPVLIRLNDDGTCESRPAIRPILIRDLLAHTSGIAYSFFHRDLARLVALGAPERQLPLLHDPGGGWTYGPSTAILGRVIENASGETLDTFCKTRIFDPLGMADTAYAVPPSQCHRVITIHQSDPSGTLVERPNPATIQSRGRGDDGLFSTAADYTSFLQLFLNGGCRGSTRVVGEETLGMMTSNQIGGLTIGPLIAPSRYFAGPFPAGGRKDQFGFGFQIETEPSDPAMRSPGSLSWAGVFNTYFWFDPLRKLAAVVLMQLLPGNDLKAIDLLRGFERLVYAIDRQPAGHQ